MTRVHGGWSNRLWRLETERGVFAVKQLRVDRGAPHPADAVFRLEQVAFAAGIPMPEPISADDEVLVHRWVDGDKVPEEPVSPAFGHEIGEILARLHALDIQGAHVDLAAPMPTDWPGLAARAVDTHQPWADELLAAVDTLMAIAAFVDGCERRSPVVVTHRDITPWNLLAADGQPILLDWEIAGEAHLAGELGSTALNLCKREGFDTIDPAAFRSVLDGYVAGGGTLPEPGPDWFVDMIAGWFGFTHWNIERSVAGVEASTGPELALSQESAGNGVRGLPEMFERLPVLEDRLLRSL
jgi:aminoglycoside phosphotransferase (APT) family kinase protein